MQPVKPLIILTTLVIALALVACEEEQPSSTTQLDAPRIAATLTAEGAQATATAPPTPRPSSTPRPTQTAPATQTPFPTLERDPGTEEPVDNTVPAGSWLDESFTTDNEQQHTLRDYLGRVVLLHTMGLSCDLCLEQQQAIMNVLAESNPGIWQSDAVILTLGVNDREPPASLKTYITTQLSEAWNSLAARLGADTEYVFGSASQELLDALVQDFGPLAADPGGLTIIIIEEDGRAHLLTEGMVSEDEIRNVLYFYTG